MAWLDDIANKLILDGVVQAATGWDISKSYLPNTVVGVNDQLIAIFETPSPHPQECFFFPNFSIHVRGKEYQYDVARAKCDQVIASLDNKVFGAFSVFLQSSGVFPGGYDTNNRPVLIINFAAHVQRS